MRSCLLSHIRPIRLPWHRIIPRTKVIDRSNSPNIQLLPAPITSYRSMHYLVVIMFLHCGQKGLQDWGVWKGNYVAINGSSSPLKALAASPTDGAALKSSFGAAGKSSLLTLVGMFSFLITGSDLTAVGDADLPRALPINSCAFWE